MGSQELIQLIQHNSRTDAHRTALHIQVTDLPVKSREIYDQSFSNCAPRQTRSSSTRRDGYPCIRRRFNNGTRLPNPLRKRDANGLELIMRSVSGIDLSGQIVEGELAIRPRERRLLLSRNRHAVPTYRRSHALTTRNGAYLWYFELNPPRRFGGPIIQAILLLNSVQSLNDELRCSSNY